MDTLKLIAERVKEGKIDANKIFLTLEPLEGLKEIPEGADEEMIRQIEEENEQIAERNRLRKQTAKALSELVDVESLSVENILARLLETRAIAIASPDYYAVVSDVLTATGSINNTLQAEGSSYVTINFTYDSGVDSILIVQDGDAEISYSTDGSTWNTIEEGKEVVLSATQTQIKFKFDNFTYFNGYAFLVW